MSHGERKRARAKLSELRWAEQMEATARAILGCCKGCGAEVCECKKEEKPCE